MSTLKIRCPDCGRRVPPEARACAACRASLVQMCSCGATALLSVTTCADCGAELDPPAYRRRPFALRLVAVVVLLGLLVGAAGALWNASQRKERKAALWRLSDAAFEAVKAGRYEEALPLLRSYVQERPRDSQMLYLLAISERQLSDDPLAGADAARAALDVDGSFSEAAALLAAAYESAGDVERALEYAQRAVDGLRGGPDELRRLALLHLRQRRPDYAAALAALQRSVTPDRRDPATDVLIAVVELRRAGGVPLANLGDEALARVSRAEAILFGDDDRARSDPLMRLASIELLLARRQPAAARRLATQLLAEPSASPLTVQRARTLVARAALQEGETEAAREALRAALEGSPTRAVAGEVAAIGQAGGHPELALGIVRSVLSRPGTDPGVADVVPALLAACGRAEEAIAEARGILTERPGDVDLQLQLAQLLADAGDLAGADAALARAEAAADRQDARASLRRAFLRVARASTEAARRTEAAEQARNLDVRLGEPLSWTDPDALAVRARLAITAAQTDEARELVERALALDPADADLHILRAEMVLLDESPDAVSRATAILSEAVELAPFDAAVVARAARLLISAGEPRRANAECQRLLDRVGDVPEVLDVAAEALRRVGRWGDAANRLERLRALGAGNSAVIQRKLVDSLLRAGETERARELAAEVDPEGADARLEALIGLHEATTSQRLDALRRIGPSMELAYACLAAGDVAAALETLRALLGQHPEPELARRTLVLLLLEAPEAAGGEQAAEASVLARAAPESTPLAERLLMDAAIALHQGDLQAASELTESALREAPDDPVACMLRARTLFEGGERAAALGPMRRAVGLPGALPGFPGILADVLYAVARDTADAGLREHLLWEALQHDTVHVGATVDLVQILFDAGRESEAASLARRLLATASLPDDLARDLRRLATAAAARATGLEQFLGSLDDLAVEDVTSVDDLLDGLLLLLRGGRDLEALDRFQAVAARHPGNPMARLGIIEAQVRLRRLADARATVAGTPAEDTPAARVHLLSALVRAGLHAEALAEAAALDPEAARDEEIVELRVHAALRLGNGEEALSLLRTAESAAGPGARERLRLLRSSVLRELGEGEAALEIARNVRGTAPGEPALVRAAVLAEAEALLELRRFDEAKGRLALLDAATAEPPGSALRSAARIAFVRGTLALVEGRSADAEAAFREALLHDVTAAPAANNLAWLLAARPSRAEEAFALSRQATARDAENPDYWDTRATCAHTLGLAAEAESSWRRALELLRVDGGPPDSRHVSAWIGLAELCAERSDLPQATALARQVLAARASPDAERRARAVLQLR